MPRDWPDDVGPTSALARQRAWENVDIGQDQPVPPIITPKPKVVAHARGVCHG